MSHTEAKIILSIVNELENPEKNQNDILDIIGSLVKQRCLNLPLDHFAELFFRLRDTFPDRFLSLLVENLAYPFPRLCLFDYGLIKDVISATPNLLPELEKQISMNASL